MHVRYLIAGTKTIYNPRLWIDVVYLGYPVTLRSIAVYWTYCFVLVSKISQWIHALSRWSGNFGSHRLVMVAGLFCQLCRSVIRNSFSERHRGSPECWQIEKRRDCLLLIMPGWVWTKLLPPITTWLFTLRLALGLRLVIGLTYTPTSFWSWFAFVCYFCCNIRFRYEWINRIFILHQIFHRVGLFGLRGVRE